jgi:predicted dehydrogenase
MRMATVANNDDAPTEDKAVPVLRYGIVGCGSVCEVKSGPAFYKGGPKSSLVAVMRRDMTKARAFAERHGVEKYYDKAADLIDDDSVDVIYVATPPGGDRVGIARMIANAKKPCYMEKPLGRDGKEAQEICSVFQKAGVPLYVAYYRRCMPKFVYAKRALDDKRVGEITGVTATLHQSRHRQKDKSHWHYTKEISGGGLFLDVGCHVLDLIEFLVGPIENPTGRAFLSIKDQSVEDNVRGFWEHTLESDSDSAAARRRIGGSCVFNFASGGPRRDELEIVGTLGTLTISCFDAQPAQLKLDGGETLIDLPGDHPDTVQQPMIALMTDDILAQRRKKDEIDENEAIMLDEVHLDPRVFLCNGESAVRTSVAMDRFLGRETWLDDYIIT